MEQLSPCTIWLEKLALRPEDLSTTERAALEAHVGVCPSCRMVQEKYANLVAHLHTLSSDASAITPLPRLPVQALLLVEQRGEEREEIREASSFTAMPPQQVSSIPILKRTVKQALTGLLIASILLATVAVYRFYHAPWGGSGGTGLHPGSSGATWCVVSSPNRAGGSTILDGVAASSASDAWAVGSSNLSNESLYQPVVEHWNGSQWSIVPSPNPAGAISSFFNSVSVVSEDDAWAVGSFVVNKQGISQPLIEHWNGSRWSIVPSPNIGGGVHSSLNGVTAFSANDIWAVGWREVPNLPSKTLIEHWNGTRWSIVASPNPGQADNPSGLSAITVNSANDVWAVGFAYSLNEETLIEHWNGTQWSIVSNPNPARAGSSFLGVTAISANDVWAVGVSFTYTRATQVSVTRTLIEHWNGTQWSIVASPSPGSTDNLLSGVTAISSSNIWAVGGSSNSRPGSREQTGQMLIEHWNGTRWNIVASPSPGPYSTLEGVGRVPHSSAVLAVGVFSSDTSTPYKTLTKFTCK